MRLTKEDIEELLNKYINAYKQSEEYIRKLLLNLITDTYIEIDDKRINDVGIFGFYYQESIFEDEILHRSDIKYFCTLHTNTDFFRVKNKSIYYNFYVPHNIGCDDSLIVDICVDKTGKYWEQDILLKGTLLVYNILWNKRLSLNCNLENICIEIEEEDDLVPKLKNINSKILDKINSSNNVLKCNKKTSMDIRILDFIKDNNIQMVFRFDKLVLQLLFSAVRDTYLDNLCNLIKNKRLNFSSICLEVQVVDEDYKYMNDIVKLIDNYYYSISNVYCFFKPLKTDIINYYSYYDKNSMHMFIDFGTEISKILKKKNYLNINSFIKRINCTIDSLQYH